MFENIIVRRRQLIASAIAAAAAASPLTALASSLAVPAVKGTPTSLTPYLLFDGTCEEAMGFYQSVFGGKLNLAKVKDSVMKSQMPPSLQDRVLNAHLQSDRIEFSASDWLRRDRTRVRGNTACLYLSGGASEQLRMLFDKLSAEAEITDPLKIQPFGTYGALNDKFGVRWMFWTGAEAS